MADQAYKICFCFQRIFRLKPAEVPEDIESLFDEYSDNGLMTVDKLHKFLVNVQREEAAFDHAQAIFRGFNHVNVFRRKGINLHTFFRYLFGDMNSPIPTEVYHAMNAPLAHYFMYTGHNSYLTGNQMSSKSSTRPIIEALKRGVRVIELDLWPNSKGNDVIVRHGGTLTTSVKLIKCLEAIKEYAFYNSNYPVIITFEDHLDPLLQDKVAKMVKKKFGNLLFEGDQFPEFPSPEELKRKILVSTKPPKKLAVSMEKNKDKVDKTSTSETRNELYIQIKLSQNDENEGEEVEEEETSILKYEDLIAIHAIKGKDNLETLLKENFSRAARLSLSEKMLQDAVKTLGTDIVRFTQRNLLRVYPRGSHVLSSNFDPLTAWIHGAQMVAFNMQRHDRYLWIMQGMFRANGGCGYVKKPHVLLSDEVFNPSYSIGERKPTRLKVKVYMGDGWLMDFRATDFDTCSPPDFFAELEIHGVPADDAVVKTKVVKNQWTPMWNQEFYFELRVPELAMLRIEVCEFDRTTRDDFGGQTCLPVSELRTGVRAVPLYDKKGIKYQHVKLLMKFDSTQD